MAVTSRQDAAQFIARDTSDTSGLPKPNEPGHDPQRPATTDGLLGHLPTSRPATPDGSGTEPQTAASGSPRNPAIFSSSRPSSPTSELPDGPAGEVAGDPVVDHRTQAGTPIAAERFSAKSPEVMAIEVLARRVSGLMKRHGPRTEGFINGLIQEAVGGFRQLSPAELQSIDPRSIQAFMGALARDLQPRTRDDLASFLTQCAGVVDWGAAWKDEPLMFIQDVCPLTQLISQQQLDPQTGHRLLQCIVQSLRESPPIEPAPTRRLREQQESQTAEFVDVLRSSLQAGPDTNALLDECTRLCIPEPAHRRQPPPLASARAPGEERTPTIRPEDFGVQTRTVDDSIRRKDWASAAVEIDKQIALLTQLTPAQLAQLDIVPIMALVGRTTSPAMSSAKTKDWSDRLAPLMRHFDWPSAWERHPEAFIEHIGHASQHLDLRTLHLLLAPVVESLNAAHPRSAGTRTHQAQLENLQAALQGCAVTTRLVEECARLCQSRVPDFARHTAARLDEAARRACGNLRTRDDGEAAKRYAEQSDTLARLSPAELSHVGQSTIIAFLGGLTLRELDEETRSAMAERLMRFLPRVDWGEVWKNDPGLLAKHIGGLSRTFDDAMLRKLLAPILDSLRATPRMDMRRGWETRQASRGMDALYKAVAPDQLARGVVSELARECARVFVAELRHPSASAAHLEAPGPAGSQAQVPRSAALEAIDRDLAKVIPHHQNGRHEAAYVAVQEAWEKVRLLPAEQMRQITPRSLSILIGEMAKQPPGTARQMADFLSDYMHLLPWSDDWKTSSRTLHHRLLRLDKVLDENSLARLLAPVIASLQTGTPMAAQGFAKWAESRAGLVQLASSMRECACTRQLFDQCARLYGMPRLTPEKALNDWMLEVVTQPPPSDSQHSGAPSSAVVVDLHGHASEDMLRELIHKALSLFKNNQAFPNQPGRAPDELVFAMGYAPQGLLWQTFREVAAEWRLRLPTAPHGSPRATIDRAMIARAREPARETVS